MVTDIGVIVAVLIRGCRSWLTEMDSCKIETKYLKKIVDILYNTMEKLHSLGVLTLFLQGLKTGRMISLPFLSSCSA